jgi:hypothetical protein
MGPGYKGHNTALAVEKEIRSRTEPFTDYPMLFISATNKQRIHRILEAIDRVNGNRNRKISTSEMNEVFLRIVNDNPPPASAGRHIKIKYVTQLPVYAPTFAFFCNYPASISPLQRFIENRIRKNYDFCGVPLRIYFRKNSLLCVIFVPYEVLQQHIMIRSITAAILISLAVLTSCGKIESLPPDPYIEYTSFTVFDTVDQLGNEVWPDG